MAREWALEDAAVVVNETQDGRADGKDEAGGIEAALGQDMVNEPAVDPSVSVLERMNIDKAKRRTGRGDDGIEIVLDRSRVNVMSPSTRLARSS